LEPGHTLTFSLKEKLEKMPATEKYWSVYDAYNQPKMDLSFQEAKIETEKVRI
jgi:hypothetical protein